MAITCSRTAAANGAPTPGKNTASRVDWCSISKRWPRLTSREWTGASAQTRLITLGKKQATAAHGTSMGSARAQPGFT